MKPKLILVNPWVYDFAAYDLWSKPLGLLYLAGYLRACGFDIRLIDCLDIHNPGMKSDTAARAPQRRLYGTGKFYRQEVPTPAALSHVPRPYARYGITPELFERELAQVSRPSAVLVTSLMTYWYDGVRAAIELIRKVHPGVPVFLGGSYARLCESHAEKTCGADRVLTGNGPAALLDAFDDLGIGVPSRPPPAPFEPYPAFDLLSGLDYVCVLTSVGCPYHCQYCASGFLNPRFIRRPAREAVKEILFWHRRFGVRDIAFYDDALLAGSADHAVPLLEALEGRGSNLRFHTPNALHVKEVTGKIARLLHRAGFRTIRLGLETADAGPHRALDDKVSPGDFQRAVGHLHDAGYDSAEIGAYVLVGLPGQPVDSVLETLNFVEKVGAVPYLSEYSPIPHTVLWDEAVRCSRYDLVSEPLFHNNTLLPCWDEARARQMPLLKQRVREIRQKFR
ncbi:MAG: radical SAM protein [Deltaproteobacteria bacterium]|nr:radical SAM protein [Deltaproteobacteria bacterium]MBW2283505.1 radical SAM protein [Deltaproteobacteria bacterium]